MNMDENKQEELEQETVIDDSNDSEAAASKTPDEDKNNELSEKLSEYKDKYLRLAAEFDNYRKRTLKERMEMIKTASEDLVKELLPVIDDFDRAVSSIETGGEQAANPVFEGVVLIYNKLKSVLEQKGLAEVTPVGENFDADLHEAIAKIPVNGKEQAGKIVDVVQKGYSLNDKIIRHPKVVVGE
jgi:molecular chaperone GrpE